MKLIETDKSVYGKPAMQLTYIFDKKEAAPHKDFTQYDEISVQVSGENAESVPVSIQVSNDGVDFHEIYEFTGKDIKSFKFPFLFIKPVVVDEFEGQVKVLIVGKGK